MFQSTYNAALSGNPQSATSQQYPNGNPDGTLNPPAAKNTDSCVALQRTGKSSITTRATGLRPAIFRFAGCTGPTSRH